MRSTALTPEQNVARTIAAVDAHFHEENPQESKGVDLYGDSVVRKHRLAASCCTVGPR